MQSSEMVGQTCRMSNLNNQNINVQVKTNVLSKFVAKLLKYSILFKNILIFAYKIRIHHTNFKKRLKINMF